ncbi:MAG TPA: phosphohistidine phosphatase SixA [Polyangia bacterium]|jgi:phosphohistidine phosphatase
MDVTVIRHGTAEDRAPSDAERALTATGQAEAARAGERVAQTAPPPDLIVSSPYLRARQTADAVAARVGLAGQVELDEALVPEASPEGVRELLSRLTARHHVVLVAHEPILSAVCGLLLGRSVHGLRRAEILSMQSGDGPDVRPGGFTFRFRA